MLLRPAEQASGYHDVLFKKSLLSCEFVDMSMTGGGVDARPMEPVFSYASLSSQQQVFGFFLVGCPILSLVAINGNVVALANVSVTHFCDLTLPCLCDPN